MYHAIKYLNVDGTASLSVVKLQHPLSPLVVFSTNCSDIFCFPRNWHVTIGAINTVDWNSHTSAAFLCNDARFSKLQFPRLCIGNDTYW